MKDQLALLLAGLAGSLLAWTFWHWMGADGFNAMALLFMTVLFVDNRRLRARLRENMAPVSPPRPSDSI